MFRSSLKRMRSWLELADAALGDPPVEAPHHPENLHHDHPHRRPLKWDRARRPGQVPAAPAHCLSPVRHPAAPRQTSRDGGRDRVIPS
jgi:hypothetical protein